MSDDVLLLIVFVGLALGVSFLCSVLEAVLLSITPSYLAQIEKEGSTAVARLRALKQDIDRPLAAILSLNTIAHTVGAAGAGAQAAKVFGSQWLGVASAVLTLLILILSEIVPKSLGALYWRQLAPAVGALLVPLIWAMYPLVLVARGITSLLGGGHAPAGVSREEISAMAEEGADRGVFDTGESRVLKNMFRLRELRAADVMTPRTVIFALPETMKVGEVLEQHGTLRFARIPLYTASHDDISGYVLRADLLSRAARDEHDVPLSELRRELQIVPEVMPLSKLFDLLLEGHRHIALVVDEYGGTAGLVSQEDLVETLLGLEIVDEVDSVQDMQDLARRQWRRRARRLGLIDGEEGDAPPAPGTAANPAPPAEPQSGPGSASADRPGD